MKRRNLFSFEIASFYFFHFAFVGINLIYLPKVLMESGFDAFEIGIIFSIIPLSRFLIPLFFIRHFTITKNTIQLSAVIFIFASVSLVFTIQNFYLLVLTQIFMGVSISLLPPFVETVALWGLQKERYGKIRLFGSIGFIVSALAFANLLQDPQILIIFMVFFSILTSYFVFRILKRSKENVEIFCTDNKNFSLFDHKYVWLNVFLMQISFGPFYNFFTIYEIEQGFGVDVVSYLWTFGVACEIFMLYFQTPLLKKYDLLNLIAVSVLVTAFRWLLLYLFPASILISFFTQSLHALGFALYHTAVISYLYHVYKEKNLAQQFYGGISYGLGLFAGSMLSGMFYGEYIFLYASAVAFVAFLVIIYAKRDFYNKKLTRI